MDAAQPSGNVQSVGSRPSIMTGYYAAVSNLHSGLMFRTGTPHLYCKAVSWEHDARLVVQMV